MQNHPIFEKAFRVVRHNHSAYPPSKEPVLSPRRNLFKELVVHAEVRKALGSGLLMLAGWGMSQVGIESLSVVLYVLAYVLGGWSKAREGTLKLFRDKALDVNLLMIAAAVGAASIGYWSEGALLIFIFALSGALEEFASDRSGRDISELIALRPERAIRIEGDAYKEVEVSELAEGNLILVRAGENIPADGRIVAGASTVNQSSITGESLPVDREAGEDVYAGSLNGAGTLRIEVTRKASETLLASMIAMVEQARESSPNSQRFIQRFEAVYVKLVLAAALMLIAAGPFIWEGGWQTSFYKGMLFLVVASPCAVVASVMPAVLSAMSSAARRNVLFKGGVPMERLSEVDVVAFDKTGTLTLGEPELTEVSAAPGWHSDEVLRFAASVERHSSHPLAQAVVRAAEQAGLVQPEAEVPEEKPGFGIAAAIEGRSWSVGRYPASASLNEEWRESELRRLNEKGQTVSFVICEGETVGMLALRDQIRPETRSAVQKLKAQGVKVAMLTGDSVEAGRAIAAEAGIELVFAGLLPTEKVARVRQLKKKYGSLLMVGDGVNDAPAMAAADVGMGMGIRGSAAALGTADVVLMKDDLSGVADTLRLAKRTSRIIRQNLIFSCIVIVSLIASAFSFDLALPFGVMGHEGSTLLVILNGLRLLAFHPKVH